MSAWTNRALLGIIAGLALAAPGLALAQTSASAYTYATRYDAMGRTVGTIAPDPDDTGPIHFAATRTTYDDAGRVTRVETGELSGWQDQSILPKDWTGFTDFAKVETSYDALDRKTLEVSYGWNPLTTAWVANGATQYSYDGFGRLECAAVRMNPALYGSLPSSACTLGTAGSQGNDRITRNSYDAAGQLLKVQKAYGSPRQEDYATNTYTVNGKLETMTDAGGNKATMVYDAFDLQIAWVFPSRTSAGSSATCNIGTPSEALESGVYVTNPALTRNAGDDCEKYSYDRNGNRKKLVKRDGQIVGYDYDALGRMSLKHDPNSTAADVYYDYDLRGLQLSARFGSGSGAGITNGYDGFGRLQTSSSNMFGLARTLTYAWDADGARTQVIHPDSAVFAYGHDKLDRVNAVNEGTSTNLVQVTYASTGAPSVMNRASGSASSYTFGVDLRLSAIQHDLANSAQDVTYGFAYNPAGQITSRTRSNDSYAFNAYASVSRSYTANGLNQYTAAGGAAFCYDDNGNLTSDGTRVYRYDAENRLVEVRAATSSACPASYTGALIASLSYDPLGRLYQVSAGSAVTRFLYDGDELVAEYDGSNNLLRRYVHGSGADDPLVWYEGSSVGASNRRFYYADHQGSIVAVADNSGASLGLNSYDEYGIPGSGNAGRFQYTGQAWLSEIGMYYYKARIYSPTLGRFLQTDPIGYKDQNNLYAYVGNDPVDGIDPSGTDTCTGSLLACRSGGLASGSSGFSTGIGESKGRELAALHRLARIMYAPGRSSNGHGQTTWLNISGLYSASPEFVRKYDGSPQERMVQTLIYMIAAGSTQLSEFKGPTALEGSRLNLNRKLTYDRYNVLGFPDARGVPQQGRLAVAQNGSPGVYYYGPYHGKPGPGVKDGWIAIVFPHFENK